MKVSTICKFIALCQFSNDAMFFTLFIHSNSYVLILAVIFFTDMLGPEEEGKISHVTEIEISERATGKK